MIVRKKARFLQADDVCLLEERLNVCDYVVSARETVRRIRILRERVDVKGHNARKRDEAQRRGAGPVGGAFAAWKKERVKSRWRRTTRRLHSVKERKRRRRSGEQGQW